MIIHQASIKKTFPFKHVFFDWSTFSDLFPLKRIESLHGLHDVKQPMLRFFGARQKCQKTYARIPWRTSSPPKKKINAIHGAIRGTTVILWCFLLPNISESFFMTKTRGSPPLTAYSRRFVAEPLPPVKLPKDPLLTYTQELLQWQDNHSDKLTWYLKQPVLINWMFGETSMFHVKIWNHPIETTILPG